MSIVTLAVVRLECSFHSSKPLGNNTLPLKKLFWSPKNNNISKFHKGSLRPTPAQRGGLLVDKLLKMWICEKIVKNGIV
jgi:hypothetical protein